MLDEPLRNILHLLRVRSVAQEPTTDRFAIEHTKPAQRLHRSFPLAPRRLQHQCPERLGKAWGSRLKECRCRRGGFHATGECAAMRGLFQARVSATLTRILRNLGVAAA